MSRSSLRHRSPRVDSMPGEVFISMCARLHASVSALMSALRCAGHRWRRWENRAHDSTGSAWRSEMPPRRGGSSSWSSVLSLIDGFVARSYGVAPTVTRAPDRRVLSSRGRRMASSTPLSVSPAPERSGHPVGCICAQLKKSGQIASQDRVSRGMFLCADRVETASRCGGVLPVAGSARAG